jgi:hypothetical protein
MRRAKYFLPIQLRLASESEEGLLSRMVYTLQQERRNYDREELLLPGMYGSML